MLDRIESKLTGKRRRYLYRVSAALVALAATYGLVSGEESAGLLYLFSAVFGVADRNVNDD